jgi:hypothetical protein
MKTKERNEGKPRVRIEDLIELAGSRCPKATNKAWKRNLPIFSRTLR